MVSEARCMSFPCTELLLFNYAEVKTDFHSMAPLRQEMCINRNVHGLYPLKTVAEHNLCQKILPYLQHSQLH